MPAPGPACPTERFPNPPLSGLSSGIARGAEESLEGACEGLPQPGVAPLATPLPPKPPFCLPGKAGKEQSPRSLCSHSRGQAGAPQPGRGSSGADPAEHWASRPGSSSRLQPQPHLPAQADSADLRYNKTRFIVLKYFCTILFYSETILKSKKRKENVDLKSKKENPKT